MFIVYFKKGFSLIEVLVVITIFAVLGVLVTQSVVLTLIGSRKSESIVHARENLDYSLNVIERHIRNAGAIISTSPDNYAIIYVDQNGKTSSFSCNDMQSDDSFVASGSARLTNDSVKVTDCSFIWTPGIGGSPDLVQISMTMADSSATGVQGSSVTSTMQIHLRNY
jgi:prepilin-type N-terminal cleavage/methylation domain-containing protein